MPGPTNSALRVLLLPLSLALAACSATPTDAPPKVAHTPVSASAAPSAAAPATAGVAPPVARKEPKVERIHGYERVDEYHWLRDKGSPDVLAHLAAENAYMTAMMKPTEPLQKALYDEMLARIKETDLSVPYRKGEWLYYTRTEQGKQYPIHCRKRGSPDAPEVVILDLNELAKTSTFVGIGPMQVSDDGNLLAYGLDTTGFRQFVLHIKDLRTGELGPERIERVRSVAFASDGRTLHYTVEDPVSKRPYRLHRHTIGADAAADPLVYEEKDARFNLWVSRSRSKKYVLLTIYSATTSEERFVRADRPADALTVIAPREQDHEYYADHRGDRFYIRTNSGGRNFRLVSAPVSSPGRASWKELLPHRDDVMLEGLDAFEGHLVLHERERGLSHLRIFDEKKKLSERIPLPEPVHALAPEPNPEYKQTTFRFNYQSFVTPPTVYDYDLKKQALVLQKRTEVLGGYDPSRYETRRIEATAQDGTKIPISMVHRRGTATDGKSPMLLYGYGAYGAPLQATFNSNRFSLVDRGVIYAVAHVRGGGEMGKKWHDAGRMMSKMSTFTDFIACAEHLIAAGWTSKDRLVIQGASAGGLLMGAVTNMRPDLWKAVVAGVPFVDVMNTMLDESVPLTVAEFEEWGNPKVKEHYDYMMRYSPYDNVAARDYPAMLVQTSYNDSQVMYWEPAKWVARLRAMKTDQNPLIFRILMDPAGHGGKSGRYDKLREVAFEYAFILDQLGLASGKGTGAAAESARGASSSQPPPAR